MVKNPGYIVTTRDGKQGRTYHKKGFVNGKCAVYLYDDKGIESKTGTLCDPSTLSVKGFID
ncbi:MAG: hypothetical protein M3R27_05945 [Bacteroidota bacterium]|nr:hypothetical protein [Bacteroidota bacterium]